MQGIALALIRWTVLARERQNPLYLTSLRIVRQSQRLGPEFQRRSALRSTRFTRNSPRFLGLSADQKPSFGV